MSCQGDMAAECRRYVLPGHFFSGLYLSPRLSPGSRFHSYHISICVFTIQLLVIALYKFGTYNVDCVNMRLRIFIIQMKGQIKSPMTTAAQSKAKADTTDYTSSNEAKDKALLLFGLGLTVFAGVLAGFAYGLGSAVYFIRFLGVVVFSYSLLGYGRKFRKARAWAVLGRNIMKALAVVALVCFVVIGIFIIKDKRDDLIPESAQYAIVLGAGLQGETPSLVLESRLIGAREFLQNHPESIAILSGGQGVDESISEAEAMRRYLTQNGIANERLWLEEQSTSTSENFAFSRNLLEEKLGLSQEQPLEIVIVTSDFHLYRAKLLAKRNNLIGYSISCPTPNIIILPVYYHIRECASVFFAYLGR